MWSTLSWGWLGQLIYWVPVETGLSLKLLFYYYLRLNTTHSRNIFFIEILISFNRPKSLLRRSLRGHMPQNSPKIWALVELMLKKMTYSSSRLERQVPIFYRFINQLSLKWETPNLRPRDAFYKVSNFNPPLWLILTLQNKRLRHFLHIYTLKFLHWSQLISW